MTNIVAVSWWYAAAPPTWAWMIAAGEILAVVILCAIVWRRG
jgi:hypothetical protein